MRRNSGVTPGVSWPGAAGRLVVLLAPLVLLSGCEKDDDTEFDYPGPTPAISVEIHTDLKGGLTPASRNVVWVFGATGMKGDAAATAPRSGGQVGAFRGLWAPAAIAWIADDTVNICPLNRAANVPSSLKVLLKDGRPKIIHITTDCEGKPALAVSATEKWWITPN
jgi:hypothetical protein